jgi:allophanate hydrolase subunit 2
MNDRQTIGGYPKLGSVLSLDIGKLAQLMPGGNVRFTAISVEQAHNLLALDEYRINHIELERLAL